MWHILNECYEDILLAGKVRSLMDCIDRLGEVETCSLFIKELDTHSVYETWMLCLTGFQTQSPRGSSKLHSNAALWKWK